MVARLADNQRPEALVIAAEIHRLESQADHIKNEIRKNVSHSIFTAIVREDLLHFLSTIDDVADYCQNIAKLVEYRETPIPKDLRDPMLKLSAQVISCARHLLPMTERFSKLDHAPSPEDTVFVMDKVRAIHDSEHQSDLLEEEMLKQVFKLEDSMKPLSVIFLMKFTENFGIIANKSQNTADAFQRLALK
jgi:predicted phosphate transport protein (TIGR00153 family)